MWSLVKNMSRIGKKLILIPGGVDIKVEAQKVTARGPKGELYLEVHKGIAVEIKDNQLFVTPKTRTIKSGEEVYNAGKKAKALWGLTRALLANIVEGVNKGFEKKLEIHGIGYKARVEGDEIILNVGFSHPVNIKIPEELQVSVEKNIIIISGINKALVGQLSAVIRKVKPPEPYKGKGIRYQGEYIRRKVGKRVATTS